MPSVKDYINYFSYFEYKNLFNAECYRRLNNVVNQYGNLNTHETIIEVCLSNDDKTCDYSIMTDSDREHWLELDFNACKDTTIVPCQFIDGKNFTIESLAEIASIETIEHVKSMLLKCVDLLTEKGVEVYQIGSMTSRNHTDRLRFFTDDMSRDTIIEYLRQLNWNGDSNKLNKVLAQLEPYSDKHNFIIDFDVFSDHISDKIGINFGTVNKKTATIKSLLKFLHDNKLCTAGKMHDVLKFIDDFPQCEPYIQNDISHFKLPFMNNHVTMTKAYLRQGDIHYPHDFRAWSAPVIMNLELTTRCPLRCPQCYCDFSNARNMDKSTALHWINQAAEAGVKTVNLSGGETLCYPYLDELIIVCNELNLEANVALSGYKADRDRLIALIQSGVADICISLNGSTAAINSKSRDGYELAVNALEILKEIGYNRTCINWVMHSFNADDFDNMIALAEFYGVNALAVMMFKPDCSNSMNSVPTKEQVLNVAKIIRKYKGNVNIEVEECFSQMRAVVGERFFINYNVGMNRGCGAGRDGFSVNVDGLLTPCRHLYNFKETFDNIHDYWIHSPVLNELRTTEDRISEPCINCKYNRNCLPCMAVVWNFHDKFFMGDDKCPLR